MSEITVENRPGDARYEARSGDEVAGFISYELGDGVIDLQHTEVGDEFGGQGVGSTLVRETLDDIRTQGDRQVVATCPFVDKWITKHPEYEDLRAQP